MSASLLADLNPPQREAVVHRGSPLLLLAGAGSGKTRVVTTRIAHLIATGALPESILAVTFTNKAAGEMQARIGSILGADIASRVTASTFHRLGVRILREDGHHVGIPPGFTILDSDDQIAAIRDVMRAQNVDMERYEPDWVLHQIGRSRNASRPYRELVGASAPRNVVQIVERIQAGYDAQLRAYQSVDFDDLLTQPLRLLQERPEVLQKYRSRFQHVHVDEFQDTNGVQLELVRLLSEEHRSLCVVGDDDQSIYAWRGAQPSNILEFERWFPDAHMIALTQNYRSTSAILDAANAVIANNRSRREKSLWTSGNRGEDIQIVKVPGPEEEAERVVSDIERCQMVERRRYSDFGVLFRANSQARALEEAFRMAGVPYRLFGARTFFDRKEIKDSIAYIKAILNPADEVAIRRAMAFPSRGIGPATIQRVMDHARSRGISFADALVGVAQIGGINQRIRQSCADFARIFGEKEALERPGPGAAARVLEILREARFREAVLATSKDFASGHGRWSRVEDFVDGIRAWLARGDQSKTLGDYLRHLSLETRDDDSSERDEVSLMTLHSAKGLEFPVVHLVGVEEGFLPHWRSVETGDVDEERRLFYVGITRAQVKLTISHCTLRRKRGDTVRCVPGRFLAEMPDDGVVRLDRTKGEEGSDEGGREAARARLASLFADGEDDGG